MKRSKKIITLLAVVLAFSLIVSGAFAASDTSVEAGKSVSVTFAFADIYNIDGEFTVSDPQNIISTYSIRVVDAGATAAVVNGNRLWASPTGEPVKTTVFVAVTLSVKPGAAAGSNCAVTFTGIYGDADEEPGNEHDIVQSAVVSVKAVPGAPTVTPTPVPSAAPSPSVGPTPAVTPAPSAEPTATPTPVPSTEPTPSATPSPSADPLPTETATPSTQPTPTSPGVDYSELQKQINIARGLIPSDYTNDSRDQLAAALNTAQNALNSSEQSVVTDAAEELRTAIAGLVAMDYSGLKAALSQADTLLASEQAAVLLQELSDAAQRGGELLRSGDQQAVDQAVKELTDILDRLAALLDVESGTKVVIQEVPVEVPPEGDYCNMPNHHVWPILFWVSLAVNVFLLGGIAAYLIRRARNRKDYAPMVDYDIDDDI